MKVLIRECKNEPREWIYRPRTSDPQEAIDRTVKRFWGSKAFFRRDYSLRGGVFGQVFRDVTQSGEVFTASAATDRVTVSIG